MNAPGLLLRFLFAAGAVALVVSLSTGRPAALRPEPRRVGRLTVDEILAPWARRAR